MKHKKTSKLLFEALTSKYVAQFNEAKATLAIYFTHPVAIGEHPQHIEEMDKLVSQMADAHDKLDILNTLDY
jgi:methylaspartate ammonia-lyase